MDDTLVLPLKSPYEFNRVLVLSTRHIRKSDSRLLDERVGPVISYGKMISRSVRIGDWVNIPQDDLTSGFAEMTESAKRAGYSKEFVDLLWLARQLDCQWLMLDCDGPKRDDLPWFDW